MLPCSDSERAVPARCLAAAWQPRPGPAACSSCLAPLASCICAAGAGKAKMPSWFAPRCMPARGVMLAGGTGCSDPLGPPHLLYFKYCMATAFSLVQCQDFHQHSSRAAPTVIPTLVLPALTSSESHLEGPCRLPAVGPFLCQTDLERVYKEHLRAPMDIREQLRSTAADCDANGLLWCSPLISSKGRVLRCYS